MWRTKKAKDMIRFLGIIGGIVLLNIFLADYFFRIDLTEEKRYTISDASVNLLENLKEEIYIEVYLEGDMPAGFKRLQKSVKETLDEFKVYAGKNIVYNFVDPAANSNQKERNDYIIKLAKKGIQPTNVFDNENGKRVEKLIFPGAVISYKNKEIPVMLLSGNRGEKPQEILNQSVEGVEYQLASAIRGLVSENKKRIGFVTGHGELGMEQLADLSNTLSERYKVYKVDLKRNPDMSGLDAIIMAKPDSAVSEADKYKIDQFIMNGGKALFFIDALRINMDSLGEQGNFAFNYDHKMDDLFFRYGVRINPDLLQDIYAGAYPIVVGSMGDQPQIQMMPWPFFPVINTFGNHPIVKNLDAVFTRFVSSIDTVKAVGIVKTPLLLTSQYSRKLSVPVHVNVNDLHKEMNPSVMNKGPIPIAYLLEGKFSSLYKNRFLPENAIKSNFKAESIATKMIICSDGDLVRNEINNKNGQPFPLGYDPMTKNNFANKDFVTNALDYLLDENGIISAKKKEIKLRPLDKVKISAEKATWQLINLITPLILVVIFGFTRFYIRKRKYERDQPKQKS